MNNDDHGTLFDGAAGRMVPPWVRTDGRTEPSRELDLLTLVRPTGRRGPAEFDLDHAEVLVRCRHEVLSVAELSAHMETPVLIVKVLVSDLIDEEAVEVVLPLDYSGGLSTEQLELLLTKLQERLATY